jgi:hypothetical protein
MAAETELAVLKRRVAELEGEVTGEKTVTRHILQKVSENTDLLLEIRRELGKIGDRSAIQGAQLEAFGPKLTGIVADAMRESWKERDGD